MWEFFIIRLNELLCTKIKKEIMWRVFEIIIKPFIVLLPSTEASGVNWHRIKEKHSHLLSSFWISIFIHLPFTAICFVQLSSMLYWTRGVWRFGNFLSSSGDGCSIFLGKLNSPPLRFCLIALTSFFIYSHLPFPSI